MNIRERVLEANRVRPIYENAVDSLDKFLALVCQGYLNKAEVVDRAGHEAIRFVTEEPTDAVFLKFGRVVSLCRALLVLMDRGFVQEQGIIARAIEETNEDIMFLSVNIIGSGDSEKIHTFLSEFWKEDYRDPNDPVGTATKRGFYRGGIVAFLHRVFNQPDPSRADAIHKTIYSFYSGFTHGAAPQIMELYDFEKLRFLPNGLLGTNRHLDYVFDAANSIYRTLLSAGFLAEALGSVELLDIANQFTDLFLAEIGPDKIIKNPFYKPINYGFFINL